MRFNTPVPRRTPGHIQLETLSPSLSRRQPLLQRSKSTPSPSGGACRSSTAAEVCGETAAECAAVWCCCPCGIVYLLVLAVYKVPAEFFRRAMRHRCQRRLIKRGLSPPRGEGSRSWCRYRRRDPEFAIHPVSDALEDKPVELKILMKEEDGADKAVAALEREMWSRFDGTGFWRSPSQRETTSSP